MTVGGEGMSPEFAGKGLDAIRDAVYETPSRPEGVEER